MQFSPARNGWGQCSPNAHLQLSSNRWKLAEHWVGVEILFCFGYTASWLFSKARLPKQPIMICESLLALKWSLVALWNSLHGCLNSRSYLKTDGFGGHRRNKMGEQDWSDYFSWKNSCFTLQKWIFGFLPTCTMQLCYLWHHHNLLSMLKTKVTKCFRKIYRPIFRKIPSHSNS